jgi:hypothetical protein
MCILFHNFRLISCNEEEKLFVVKTITNAREFKMGRSSTWKCADCNKTINKTIFKGESGWKTLKLFLERSNLPIKTIDNFMLSSQQC